MSIFGMFASLWCGLFGWCTPTRNPNCIYYEQDLRDTINAGGVAKLCTVCDESDIVKLTSEIDITGKNFSVECLDNDKCIPAAACIIEGSGGHRLFSGGPINAQFDSIGFSGGTADEGGAFHLTGGTIQFNKCRFDYNTATGGDGGALFLCGSSTDVTINSTGSTFNAAAEYGGFLLATDGATVVVDRSEITLNRAEASGGLLAAKNGSKVVLRNMAVECGNQAKNGGDYLYILDGATVECQDVDFEVLASATGDAPPPFNSTTGIIGTSPSCKASMQVGNVKCKRQ